MPSIACDDASTHGKFICKGLFRPILTGSHQMTSSMIMKKEGARIGVSLKT